MADFKEIQIDGQVYNVKDETARQSSGGYAPPEDGIPKKDLVQSVQDSLELADSSLQPSDKTQLQTAINNIQAAIDAITSGDTTTAIKTFQEVINFLDGVTDDATLVGKLNELRTLINAKYSKPASGIPASDLESGVIPDVSGFATKTEVNAKANSADVYTKSEVDDKVANAGKVQSVSVNGGTPAQPDGNGNVNLVVPAGEKGDKGDTGNVEFEGLDDLVALLVNDLTTGGAGNFLSAEMGKRLKAKVDEVEANIQRLYNNLGNIAFWDAAAKSAAAPIPIDWGNPKHNVTLDLDLTNAVVTYNGTPVSDGDTTLVEEGTTAQFIVSPQSGYALALPTASAGGSSIAPVDNGNGTYTIALTMGQSDVTLAITASNVPKETLTVVNNITNAKVYHEGSEVTSGIEVNQGDTVVLTVEGDTGYDVASVTAQGATPIDNGDGTFTVSVVVSATMTLTINGATVAGLLVNNSSLVYNTSGSECFMYTDNNARNQKRLVVSLRDAVSNPTTWVGGGANYHDAAKDALYSLPLIPSGATGIKVTFTNDNLDTIVGLVSSDSKQVYTTGWKTFAEQPSKELNLASYPTAFYYVILFRVKNNGSFPNADDCMTVEELGFTLEFTYA